MAAVASGRSNHDLRYLDPQTAYEFYEWTAKWQDLLGVGQGRYTDSITQSTNRLRSEERQINAEGDALRRNVALLEIKNRMLSRNFLVELVQRNTAAKRQRPEAQGSKSIFIRKETLAGLRRICGNKEATFKSTSQASAVELALARKENLLCVLSTGGGKSIVFIVPAILEEGMTTVVVVPLVTLLEVI